MKRAVLLAVAALALPACRGGAGSDSAAPDGRDFPHVAETMDRNAPSMERLESFTFTVADLGAIPLDGGSWRGSASAHGPAPEVQLLKDLRLTGDITGNGYQEAIVLLRVRRPPLPDRTDVSVAGWKGGQLMNIAAAPLPPGVTVTGGRLGPKRIVLDGTQTAGDAAAPRSVALTYALDGNQLRLVDEKPATPGRH